MKDDVNEDRLEAYEIGYLVAGVPEEQVGAEADAVRKLTAAAGGSVIAEEAPRRERLAYAMRKKTLSGSYDKYDAAYFGWIKFDADPGKVEALRKNVASLPSILRSLLISVPRENTYLGKRAPAIASAQQPQRPSPGAAERAKSPDSKDAMATEAGGPAASVEDMDKSIDEMVKEV